MQKYLGLFAKAFKVGLTYRGMAVSRFLFNALNSRSNMNSAFDHLFTNKWLWGSFAAVILGQVLVVEVPFLQSAFGTTSLDLTHWGIAIGAGVVVLLFEEVVKAIRRARAKSI